MTRNSGSASNHYSKEVASVFDDTAGKAFDFLHSEHGMVGPEDQGGGISFRSPAYEVEIGSDPRDGLWVGFSAKIGERHLRASLQCLYVESRLGPAQDIKRSAKTTHSLQKAIESNAQALKRLIPRLGLGD